ncbi:hypothetical protein [Neobacillus cucumis]|uniref:hypothetical protein n=1 Tax=Neobacillus cucumis TaxID=1740721 RepID=UPI0028530676|nr:hypothetical protein [Neobacillus cucumis]MDR4948074.1 hypothetical protein [Neobacillus cucumis]
MSESSTGGNQTGAAEVRGGDFWDFMLFGSLGHDHESSSSSSSSSEINESNQLPSTNATVEPTVCRTYSKWKDSDNGNTQTRFCWVDGNMWEFQIRRKHR